MPVFFSNRLPSTSQVTISSNYFSGQITLENFNESCGDIFLNFIFSRQDIFKSYFSFNCFKIYTLIEIFAFIQQLHTVM